MFVGRSRELSDLRALMRKKTASLVTCRGRRRIGKSTLIREFGKDADRFLEFEGLPPRPGLSNADQLATFSQQLARQTHVPEFTLNSWPEAFHLLASTLGDEWTVILLDEISWLGGHDPDFPGHLKAAWDRMLKANPKLILVLCGSVSAWIDDNILKHTGFVGRTSWDIVLGELPLSCCDLFWGKTRTRTRVQEKLSVLSVTGGVPRYLEEIDPALSAERNIQRLCFVPEGLLFREFDQVFSDVFGKRAQVCREMLRSVTHGAKTISEMAQAIGKERGGRVSEYAQDLVLAGFLSKDTPHDPRTGRPSRLVRYRLRDNYSRFYLRYIEPIRDRIEQGLMSNLALDQLPEWSALLGLQMENLVLANIPELLSHLGLEKTPILSAGPYVQRATARRRGCQVDLLIMTRRGLYLIEIKHREHVDATVVDELREKVQRLGVGTHRSIRTVLIHSGSLSKGVQEDDYIDYTISMESMLAGE